MQFFRQVLDWDLGVQFQTLAAQNSMASLIEGATLHSWGCIPVMNANKEQFQEAADVSRMFAHCAQMRWLVIDEVSCASLHVLGCLERNCRQALLRSPWGMKANGEAVLFGGLNVILVGDYEQLPPVAERSVFSNPFADSALFSGPEVRISDALWGIGPETIPSTPCNCIVLTTQHRAVDPWQQYVLEELRQGEESWEAYCFTHGFPTRHVGSWLPDRGTPLCGNAKCQAGMNQKYPLINLESMFAPTLF